MSTWESIVMDHWEYLERFGNWKWLRLPAAGISLSELFALASGIDWAHVWPLVGLAITAIGTSLIGLWRYYRLTQIEIEAARRKAGLEPLIVTVAPGVTATVPGPDVDPSLRSNPNPNLNPGGGVVPQASPSGITGTSNPSSGATS